jgi:hypothetical protein
MGEAVSNSLPCVIELFCCYGGRSSITSFTILMISENFDFQMIILCGFVKDSQ